MMEKENHLDLSKYSKQIIHEPERRVVIGFNKNVLGKAVVTTGVPVQYNQDGVTYVKTKTMSYERHMFNRMQEQARKR